MGGKAGSGRKLGLVDAARKVEHAEALITELEAKLAEVRDEYQDALDVLKAAMRDDGSNRAQAATRRIANGSGRRAAGRSVVAKRFTEPERQELQRQLIAAMKPGRLYTGGELVKLSRFKGLEQTFVKNVRRPLVAEKRIAKRAAVKGNRSPRNVRWVRL